MMNTEKATEVRWFAEEVQPHEPSLRAYLRGSFPTVRDLDDVVQESFLRVWKARATRPVRSARAFLFQVARHLSLDLLRRERISPITLVRDLSSLPVIASGPGVVEAASIKEKVRLLAEAIDALPARCREIVILRKIQGVPQRQIAEQLGISEKTVETQVARGVNRCEQFLSRHGVHHYYDDES